ncbi:hypothetical protein KR018_004709, partial [Drosophila ironensis]
HFPPDMRPLALILALATVAGLAAASDDDPDHIITNGSPAYDGQAPYVVGLVFQPNNVWCSGTIISDTWILTSAACVSGTSGVTILFGATRISQAQFKVTVGSSAYVTGGNRLALIQIPRIGFSNRVRSVTLPAMRDRSQRYENSWANTCGWGLTTYGNSLSDWLQCVDLQIMPNSECVAFYGSSTVTDQILCTRSTNGQSTCYGDSGSPLVTRQGNILVGISEFVAASGCTLGLPAGFARVTSQLEWIRHHTGIAN